MYNYFFYNINTMLKYHIYILVAFILGISIKLYDDFTDFENLKIPSIYVDVLKMLIFMLNTIITLYDYRFSFIPIFAVLSSYLADKLRNTYFNDFMKQLTDNTIEYFKNSKLWNKLTPRLQSIVIKHQNGDKTFKDAINDNHWNVYMISSFIAILLAIILDPSQLSLSLVNLINTLTIAMCIGFNTFEPYIFPEENSDGKIIGRLCCSLFIIGIILFGNNILPFDQINYIISYSVLGYISTSVVSMYIYRYKSNKKLKDVTKTI